MKACAFCNSAEQSTRTQSAAYDRGYVGRCLSCGYTSALAEEERDALVIWDLEQESEQRRAESEANAARVEELESEAAALRRLLAYAHSHTDANARIQPDGLEAELKRLGLPVYSEAGQQERDRLEAEFLAATTPAEAAPADAK